MQPARDRLPLGDAPGLVAAQRPLVGAQVAQQDAGLALADLEPGQLLEVPGVVGAVADGHPQAHEAAALPGVPGRRQVHLVDDVAEVVELAHRPLDAVAVAEGELRHRVQRVPQRLVALGERHRLGDELVLDLGRTTEARREVDHPGRHVLDEDLQVLRALPVGERRVHLAGLGVDEPGGVELAVAGEQRVGERAVAPVDAVAVQLDEQADHGVEEARAVRGPVRGQPRDEAPVLPRPHEVAGQQDRDVVVGLGDEPGRAHRREALDLEVAQHVELVARDARRQLLERPERPVDLDEPHEVAARSDGELAQRHRGGVPLAEAGAPTAGRAAPGSAPAAAGPARSPRGRRG